MAMTEVFMGNSKQCTDNFAHSAQKAMNNSLNSSTLSGDVPQGSLVSFCLFSYNQEKFIHEAVEGAFAQTYEPLEIILSDDCSTDGTFSIMQEMAAAYSGPHRVRAVQTPQNLGVMQHVLLRGREAAGDIVVVAAGDDISLPERAARHVMCYADPRVWAVSTGFGLIDETSQPISKNDSTIGERITQRVRPGDPTYLRVLPDGYTTIQGSTASYHKRVFELVQSPGRINYAEDQLFTFMIHALGRRVDYLRQPLIMYRVHAEALSNIPRAARSWQEDELRSRQRADVEMEKIKFYIEFAESHDAGSTVDVTKLHQNYKIQQDRKAWTSLSPIARAKSITRDLLRGNTDSLVWRLARILGKSPNYWPKRQLANYEYRYKKR